MVDASTVIQATLAPIFLVNGAAIFLNFTQARLFRVVDRLREVVEDLAAPRHSRRLEHLRWQRRWQLTRAILLRNAIFFGVLVIALTVATVLVLLAPSVFPDHDVSFYAIVTFASALLSFAVALALVTADAFLSVASVRRQMREFEEDDAGPTPE